MGSRTGFFIAPANDPSDPYAAGYDDNVFATQEAAQAVLPGLAAALDTQPADWMVSAYPDGPIGDWVVGGDTAEDLDCGQVQQCDGQLMVAWMTGVRTPYDPQGLDHYATRDAAIAAYEARRQEVARG